MTPANTLPCDVHQVADGVLVIPHLLPLIVPADAYQMTVAEWFGITAA